MLAGAVPEKRRDVAEWVMASRETPLVFANVRDAQALAAMSRDLIEAGLGWDYRRERVARLIGDSDTVTLVSRDGLRIMGFAAMTFGDERAHLVLLAVRPPQQRRGIGRRLVNWLVESAMTAGVASIHVELRASNSAAFAFYRAAGFAETLRVPGYYRGRETAVRMIRMLRAPGGATQMWRPPTLDCR